MKFPVAGCYVLELEKSWKIDPSGNTKHKTGWMHQHRNSLNLYRDLLEEKSGCTATVS